MAQWENQKVQCLFSPTVKEAMRKFGNATNDWPRNTISAVGTLTAGADGYFRPLLVFGMHSIGVITFGIPGLDLDKKANHLQ